MFISEIEKLAKELDLKKLKTSAKKDQCYILLICNKAYLLFLYLALFVVPSFIRNPSFTNF